MLRPLPPRKVAKTLMSLGNETRESVAEWNRFAPEWERLAAFLAGVRHHEASCSGNFGFEPE